MGVIVLQHEAGEDAGLLGEAFARRSVAMRVVHTHAGEAVPSSLDEVGASAIVVLGGGMAVYEAERRAQVRAELHLIERALAKHAPVLGICFGSQLLASALGARVYATGRQEIGWLDVSLTDAAIDDALFAGAPRSFVPFHWHGDTFDLPKGATLLARSRMTEHQAFRFGAQAWGIQFHPEATLPIVESMVQSDELARAGLDAEALVLRSSEALPIVLPIVASLFDRFVHLVAHSESVTVRS